MERRGIWLGRERELREIDAALDDLREGRGSFVLITGEPGIGKTSLADEVAKSASKRGVGVHWGRAWEAGGAPPYWPIAQALRSAARNAPPNALREHGSELAELMPELRHRMPDLAPSSRERFQLFDAVGSFLHACSEAEPRLLVLDDLHAADVSTLLLLQFLVRDFRSRAMLVIGTYRDAEARMARDTARLLTQIARDATVLPLRRFERAEVAAYVEHASGVAAEEERVATLHARTEGNPLFLRELLALDPSAARTPDGIEEVVRARLALLAPNVRRLLEPAAILGREIDVDVLGALADADASLLSAATDAGIIEPHGSDRLRFTHVLLRQGLYEDIDSTRRTALHREAAVVLSTRDAPLAEIAHHLLAAIPVASVGEAVDAALRAADGAMTMLAFEDACDLLARAARLLEGRPDEERRRFEVWLALGVARIRSSDVDAGKTMCYRAVELARRLGDGELFARAVLDSAYEFTPGVRNRPLIALLEEALARLPTTDNALRARCMAQLAAQRQPEPDNREVIELARSAVAMARRLGDPRTLQFTITAATLAILVYADPEEHMALNEESLRLALASGERRLALRAHLLAFNDLCEIGDRGTAEVHIRAYEELAAQFPHDAFRWTGVSIRAAEALGIGAFDEAETKLAEARALVQKDATRGTSMAAQPAAFACAMERYDDIAGIDLALKEAFASVGSDIGLCIADMLVVRLHARAGDREKTARRLASLGENPIFSQIEEPAWLALLAEACFLVEDVALAERLRSKLLPRARRFYQLGHLGPLCEPPIARQVGLVEQVLGKLDDAVMHLETALLETTRAGWRAHLGRLGYELARALLSRKASGDAERARELLVEARSVATALGQSTLVARIDEMASVPAPSAIATAAAVAGTGVQVSLRREGEYWTLAHGTKTVRLKDSRGLRVLDQLLANPGQELHVLQLASAAGDESPRGDAGEMLDATAIQRYRARLLDLREELEEAEGFGDAGRTAKAKDEIDVLTHELARAVGLGGRERRAGSAAERARTTVQKRLREAIRRIEDELPAAGVHLEQTVRTGTFCGYFPAGRPRSGRGVRSGGLR